MRIDEEGAWIKSDSGEYFVNKRKRKVSCYEYTMLKSQCMAHKERVLNQAKDRDPCLQEKQQGHLLSSTVMQNAAVNSSNLASKEMVA